MSSRKCLDITQTSPHSHIPAEQGDERLAGNLNTCRLQGFSSAIKERRGQQENKRNQGKLSIQTASHHDRLHEVWNLETGPLKIFIKVWANKKKLYQITSSWKYTCPNIQSSTLVFQNIQREISHSLRICDFHAVQGRSMVMSQKLKVRFKDANLICALIKQHLAQRTLSVSIIEESC